MPHSIDEGDRIICRSGVYGVACSLQHRYEHDIECLRAYDEIYNIMERLELNHMSIEDAWELNPLTVGSVYPADLQAVS
jgi:hypothetical protein